MLLNATNARVTAFTVSELVSASVFTEKNNGKSFYNENITKWRICKFKC